MHSRRRMGMCRQARRMQSAMEFADGTRRRGGDHGSTASSAWVGASGPVARSRGTDLGARVLASCSRARLEPRS